MVLGRDVRIRDSFIAGFLISAVIELCQLVFRRGLFEWDDMIHNGLGCMVGSLLMNLLLEKWRDSRRKNGDRND